MTTEGILLRYVTPLQIFDGSTKHKCIATALAFFFECLIFGTVFIASICIPTFRNLKPVHKVFWCLSGVRAFFGFRTIVLAPIVWFADREIWEDVVFGKTLSSQYLMATIVAFFAFECTLLIISDYLFKQRSYILISHHLLSLGGFSIGLFQDHCYFLGLFIVMLEMSTPFTCLCWVLIKAKLSKTFIWKANQFFLIHLFHTRQNILFAIFYFVIRDWTYLYPNMDPALMLLLVGGSILMLVGINPYWTYRKTEQLFSGEDWNFKSAVPCPEEKKIKTNEEVLSNGSVHDSVSGKGSPKRNGNPNLNSPTKKNARFAKHLANGSPRASKKLK